MSLNIEQPDRLERKASFERRQNAAAQTLSYDMICIGFGTTALPLAASLADHNDQARVLFIEREPHFQWRPASILPEKEVGTPFLRDLITIQSPRSQFTFMNFLHATNQLVQFANNSRLTPTRRLTGQYFEWASNKIQQLGWVRYGHEAVRISPVKASGSNEIGEWLVELRNDKTRATSLVQAKRVVLATGARPHIPQALEKAPLVLHSSQIEGLLESIGTAQGQLNIAVVGSDQEAAEVFEHLHTRRQGKHTATLFLPETALRPEDEVPSVQDMLDRPESSAGHVPPEVRARLQHGTSPTPQVDIKTIERLYEAQYTQKMHERDASKWRFQIQGLREVVGSEREGERVRLVVKNPQTGEVARTAQAFDVVIAATGYRFSVDRSLLDVAGGVLDGGAVSVDGEYHINFRRGVLGDGVGLWLLGSLEDRRVRGDNFTFMAERAQRVARSVLKVEEAGKDKQRQQQRQGERAMF